MTSRIKQALINSRKRVAASMGKQLAVFLGSYAVGAIIATTFTPFLSPYLGFLNIAIWAGVTLLFVLINGSITFVLYAWLVQHYNAEPDL